MERNLTDDDIRAIVDMLEQRAVERFQTNIGKGVLYFVWTWGIRVLCAIALYGLGSKGLLKSVLGF